MGGSSFEEESVGVCSPPPPEEKLEIENSLKRDF